MSKAVLISIRPEWCAQIIKGRKTIELRKTMPKLECPFKCYIYCTQGAGKNTLNIPISPEKVRKHYEETGSMVCLNSPIGNGKVIGEFVCNVVLRHCEMANADIAEIQGLVRRDKIPEYANGKEVFGWHISDLVIYDNPKELGGFYKAGTLNASDWEYQLYDGSGDPGRSSYASYLFTRVIRKPPQSWCYVEEMPDGGADNGTAQA